MSANEQKLTKEQARKIKSRVGASVQRCWLMRYYLDSSAPYYLDAYNSLVALYEDIGVEKKPNAIKQQSHRFKRKGYDIINEHLLDTKQSRFDVALKLKQLLNAKKKTYAQFKGKFTDEREDDDNAIQAGIAKYMGDALGLGKEDKLEITGKDGGPIKAITFNVVKPKKIDE